MGFKSVEEVKLLKNEANTDYGSVVEISEKKSKKKEQKKEETSNILHLFKFTTKVDRILLITGIAFSIISGACLPILGLFFGGMTNVFVKQAVQGLISDEFINATIRNATKNAEPVAISYDQHYTPISVENNTIVYQVSYVLHEIFEAEFPQKHLWKNETTDNTPMTASEFSQTLDQYLFIYLIIGTIMMLCSFIQTVCWEYVSEHQVHNIRKIYFSQIMRQDISWYDTNDNGNLPNKLSDDLEKVRDGSGYKCAMIVQYLSTFFAGITVGLYVNFSLTLVILCVGPILIGLTAYSAKFAALTAAREQEKYAFAGAIAEETLSNMKTVQAFCGQIVSIRRYEEALEAGRKIAMSRYNIFAIFIAIMFFSLYFAYALGFWYGSKLVQDGVSTPGSVFTVFLSVIVGAFSIGNALPFFNSVSSAVGVITSIRTIISRKTTIDPYSEDGIKLEKVVGDIEFKNVSFCYPSRPNVQVLENLNLKIESGRTAAIVGSSGAGKSTIVGLILRFYDPIQGSICVDNHPINELNLNWFRKQIGIVSQEPVLFGVSIAENIRYGREDVTFWEIIDAAKGANAHDFITKLPKGYDTLVGDTGSQLSGGQKQRIAIARALVRNPKILLLDEATSALDANSESIVQEALEKAMSGRTTIVVAHRLSTVRNADTIYVMQNGALFESGNHDELMEKRSLYYHLVTAQMKSRDSETSADETNDEYPSTIDEDEELPEEDTTVEMKEKPKDTIPLGPKQLLEKIENNEEEYAKKNSTPSEEIGEKESKYEHDDKENWKVLDREVSTETFSDDNDDEYETVVTHVRETREILYSDEDENEENAPAPEVSNEAEKSIKEPTLRKRRRQSCINISEEEKKSLPFSQPEPIEKDITIWELLKFHKPEWQWFLLGLIGCTMVGLTMPIFSLYYGNIFTVFTKKGIELEQSSIFWTYMFILLAVFTGVGFYCQAKGMTTVNEKLIARVRLLVFQNVVRQPVGWFDLETSSPGILVNRLARNAPLVKAAAGLRAGQVLSSGVTLIGAFTIAYVCGWKLALILTACVPIIIFAFYKQQVLLRRNQIMDSKSMDEAGRVASETVRNIRTVQALGQEKLFASIYSENLKGSYKEAVKQVFVYSTLYAATQAITYYMYALAFRTGGYLVQIGEMQTSDVYKVFFALSLCAISVGNAFSFIQDYTKARTSARLLNYLLNRRSEIDSTSPLGIKPDIKGEIRFKNVHFCYPARSNVKILRGLNLTVTAGKTLALVGESGCGKSTVISLLERFYDPLSGSIKVDGYDIRTINLAHLRSKIGLVTQEPVLFDTTIKDNIAYGAISLKDEVPFDDIVKAAKLANVHDFVMNLPERYNTIVGERGIQLSGGQKQRVAIARALIRDPKILLLDEATSALDTENEKIVQEALDVAKKGRTCIVVAHRLSTIQNADKICVMQKGKIIEKGTHDELLVLEGHYYQLTQRQVI